MTHQMLIPEQLEFIKELDAVQVEVMVDKGLSFKNQSATPHIPNPFDCHINPVEKILTILMFY